MHAPAPPPGQLSAAPKAALADRPWFQILWFSAAMLCMPALILVLTLAI